MEIQILKFPLSKWCVFVKRERQLLHSSNRKIKQKKNIKRKCIYKNKKGCIKKKNLKCSDKHKKKLKSTTHKEKIM